MSQADLFKKLAQKRQPKSESKKTSTDTTTTESTITESKKRGRPSTGKRSNSDWVGRTYYVQKEVDLDVAEQLFKLKRQGVELDKSDLVNFLLAEWVKCQNGEQATFHIGENTEV